MGVVYVAEDTKLDRKVALKTLPAQMAPSADRLARFQREAKALAALNHPHIVTIYSVEEAEGTHFITMELVEGVSLDRGLPPGGLPLPSFIDIGIALADALAAAHEKGVVHRDLKPANVMVTKDGRAKVLDFGLAKLELGGSGDGLGAGVAAGGTHLSAAATGQMPPGQALTEVGLALGTVPYMSPEQVNGRTLDVRTDIFSMGVMFYELVTGRRPFSGRTPAETISSILRDAPRPVTDVRQDAPRQLVRIIDRCLQKDPEARFQTAKEVSNELRALRTEIESEVLQVGETRPAAALPISSATTRATAGKKNLWIGLVAVVAGAAVGLALFLNFGKELPQGQVTSTASADGTGAAPDPNSIAVLPFVNMSSDKEQEYFSDGISEELLNLLTRIPELKVAARTSSFSFKGKEMEIQEIARQLHVAHVLEGSVRKAGDEVRITSKLIHAADGFQLWSQTYDRKLNDIFAIQEEIAADVVKKLRVTLLGPAPKARTTDPEAYAHYLQAAQLGRQSTVEAFAKSDALYRQVLATDPSYAPAWDGLASNFINKMSLGLVSNAAGYALAREAATKVLELDPEYAPAHSRLGWIAMSEGDFAGAARHYERALALDPLDLRVLGNASALLQALGRLEESLALDEAIVRRDPVNVSSLFNLGNSRLFARRYDEAIASLRAALSLSPGRGTAHFTIAEVLLAKREIDAALAEMEQESSDVWRTLGLVMAYHALGRKPEADAALAEMTAKYEKDFAYNIASVHAFRGEADKAFEWLDKAVEYQDGGLSQIPVDILFDNIRSDPRWIPFLRRIGKAPEQLAKISFKVTLPAGF